MSQSETEPQVRPGNVARNMIWSILPLVGIVIAFVALCQPRVDRDDNLTSAGLEEFRQAEHAAGRSLPRPRELPGGWSVTDGVLDKHGRTAVTLTVNYRTPNADFARLVETTRTNGVLPKGSPIGEVTLGDHSWQRWRVGEDESLTATLGGVTVVIGGSAQPGELRALAAAIR